MPEPSDSLDVRAYEPWKARQLGRRTLTNLGHYKLVIKENSEWVAKNPGLQTSRNPLDFMITETLQKVGY